MKRSPGIGRAACGVVLALSLVAQGASAATTSSSQLQQARRLFEAGRYPQAIAEFRRIATAEEGSAEAVIAGYYVGLSEERRGNRDAATAAYRALLSRHGENTEMSGFARQRLRELEAGAAPRTAQAEPAAAAAPAASPTAASPTAVDRLARTVLSDIMSGDRALASAPRRTRPTRRAPAAARASQAPAVWPSAGAPGASTADGFPAEPQGADYPIAAALGSLPSAAAPAPRYPSPASEQEYPRLQSVSWQAVVPPSRGALATGSAVSTPSTAVATGVSTDAGFQPLGDGVAHATHVRRPMATTAITADVSAPGRAQTVAAWESPAVTWEVSVERLPVVPGARSISRIPPPASGTALGGPRGFAWPQGDPEGLPPITASRPVLPPIAVPAEVPSLIGADGRSRLSPDVSQTMIPEVAPSAADPAAAPVPDRAAPPAPMPMATPDARAAAMGSPWGSAVVSPAATPDREDASRSLQVPASVPVEPRAEAGLEPSTAPQPAAGAPTLEGWELPAASEPGMSLQDPTPANGAPSGIVLPAGGDFGDLSLPSPSALQDIDLPEGAQPASTGSRPAAPLRPVELQPTGVAGRSLPQAGPASPWIEKALSLKRLGQYPEAIEAYRQALAADTANPVVRNNLADMLVEQGGDLDEAIRLVTEALALEIADRGPYFSTLGWAYARRGDLEKAEQYLDEAVRVQASASRLYRRGRVYAALGQASRARADFDRALVYAEDAATASLVRQALAEMDNPIPGQGTTGIIR